MTHLFTLIPTIDPANGLMRARHFQMAYVTNDIERACDLFARQLGVASFTRLEGPNVHGGHVRTELAWVGGFMLELVQASGPGTEVFSDAVADATDFTLCHHHLGYAIESEAHWAAMLDQVARNGWSIPNQSHNAFVRMAFVQVPELPHYLEFLMPTEAGWTFFTNVAKTP